MKTKSIDPYIKARRASVAFFDIDEDPVSIHVQEGQVPVDVVMDHLRCHLTEVRAIKGTGTGDIVVHFIGHDRKPASFTTNVVVQPRK